MCSVSGADEISQQYSTDRSGSEKARKSPPKKLGPCCEISFIRKAKGISKFIREEALPAFCEQLKNYEPR
jgi:hypothetical protein